MRLAIQFAVGIMAAGVTVSAYAADNTKPTDAQKTGAAWCGFHDKAGSRVRCGFSSEAECLQTLGSKGTVCMLDPYRT